VQLMPATPLDPMLPNTQPTPCAVTMDWALGLPLVR
jgi:hypothetical protein